MNSRDRVIKSLNHQKPDKVPFDLGSTYVSGISAYALDRLRKHLCLDKRPVKIHEPFQLLGMLEEDDISAFGVDVVGLYLPGTIFGYQNENWKEWELFDGTKVLVGGNFNLSSDQNGNRYIHPQGELSASPSGKLPKNGYYFDNIIRQKPIDDAKLNARKDFSKDYQLFDEKILRHIERSASDLYANTEYAINAQFSQGSFGDFAPLPGPGQIDPDGIRDPEAWLVAHYMNSDYIKEVYEFQTEVAIENLKLYKQAASNKIQIIQISGTDFGTQNSQMMSSDMFREFYKPHYVKINEWVHRNTEWKVFYHCCGAIFDLLEDFVEMGVDILNPIQISAHGMDPQSLKNRFGDRLTFWGGGINTQKTLPFGSPDEVKKEAKELLKVFSQNGGYIFGAVHNIQANIPVENIMAFVEAVHEFNSEGDI